MNPNTSASPVPAVLGRIPAERLPYSRLYLDTLAGRLPASSYYATANAASVAALLERTVYPREQLRSILQRQNTIYGSSAQALANLDRLTDPRAVCVFTGQQAGLLGGPLLTLIKALGVVKAARKLEQELGRPVIPIFWIAGDDHDFAEVNHTWLLDRSGHLCRLSYDTPPEQVCPVADIRFSDRTELTRTKQALADCLGRTDFTDDLYALIDRTYAPGESFVSAFGRFMAALTHELGLVFYCPSDNDAKRLAAPFIKQIVTRQSDIHRALSDRNAAIEHAGYHLQVEKSDSAAHLFCTTPDRTPVHLTDTGFAVGERRLSQADLLSQIDSVPERFSTDVLTRPLLQSYLFPVLLQTGGPAELAYMAQLNPLFDVFGIPAPLQKPRPTVTLIESRFEAALTEHGLDPAEMTGDFEQIINRVLARTFPPNLEGEFAALRNDIETRFHRLREDALAFDPQLIGIADQTHGKIDFTLKQFEAKVWAAHKRKSQQTRERLYRLYDALMPNRGMQERSVNVSYFLARYGFGIVGYIHNRMDSACPDHQLISLSEYSPV